MLLQECLEQTSTARGGCLSREYKAGSLGERLVNLVHHITQTIFGKVCRGLFAKDKLIFSFLISAQVRVPPATPTTPRTGGTPAYLR